MSGRGFHKIGRRTDQATVRVLARVGRWMRRGESRFPGRRKAVVLVLTLWVVVVLGVIASTLAFDVQVGSKLALLQREQFAAYNLAKSAVAVGITHLQNDMIIDYEENPNQPYDAYSDVWAMRDLRDKERVVQVDKKLHPDRTYEVRIVDEESKIPINKADFKVVKAMMEYYGFESPDSDDIAYAIVDYRDQDDMAAGEPGAYENEYYSAELGQRVDAEMAADQLLYRCPNEPFLTTEQLLNVYGISQFPEIFLGFDPEEKLEEEMAIRDTIAKGRRVRKKRERKRGRDRDAMPMRDIITVSPEGGNGRVNINTAPVEVLTILLHASTNFASIEAAKAAAESIADFRGDNSNRAPDPETAFKSMKDVAQVPGVDVNALNQIQALGITPVFKSKTFRILGIGKTRRAERTVEAVVERNLEVYNPDDASLASNRGRGIDRKPRKSRNRKRSSGGDNDRPDDNYIRIPAVRVLQWIE